MFYHSRNGAVDVVGCDGSIDESNAEQFEVYAAQRVAKGQPRLVIDLHETPVVDSRGLEALLTLHDQCVTRGGQLRLAATPPLVQEALEITDVANEIEIFADVTQAVGSFAR